jgi:type VI secretion system lysozyme-like protein
MAEPLVRQSVLDRLIGDHLVYEGAGDRGRPPRTWDESIDVLRRNLLRDLEALLNTRQTSDPAGEPHEHLSRSVYNYGLRDITLFSADSSETPGELRRTIEATIEQYEPRLADVHVRLVESGTSTDRRVEFLVEGTLLTEPDPERVEFDTVLEITSRRFEVSPHTSTHATDA